MLIGNGSSCELSLSLGYDRSLRKSLKQTMLNQEEIFRSQVHELHRLYQNQKILMKELEMKVHGCKNSHPFQKHLKCEFAASGMELDETRMMSSSTYTMNRCLQEDKGTSRRHCLPLDLEMSAHHYSRDDKNLLDKMTYDSIDIKVSTIEDVELSLRLDSNAWEGQPCKDKAICPQDQPTYRVIVTKPAFGYDDHFTNGSRKYDSFGAASESVLLGNRGQKPEENKHFTQGFEQCHDSIEWKNTSSKRKGFASHDMGELDLNKALPDDYESCDHPNSEPNKSMCEQIGGSVLTTVDVNSVCGSPCENKMSEKISTPEIHDKKHKKEKMHSNSSIDDSNKSLVSCKSWMTDDVSSSNKAGQCGSNYPDGCHDTEVDGTVREGAVSLMHLWKDCEFVVKEEVVAESSSESYEAGVLKLKECSGDDGRSCAWWSEVEATSGGGGVKVRRGRRMKDFRKEILPGLGSLSREDINEDIRAMEVGVGSRKRTKKVKKWRRR